MTRKLFVSHSSKTPENLDLLHGVCVGLKTKGFEILVDRGGDLYAGVDWDLRINEWMAECHAAVILFSQAALHDSDWVKKEAAILSWRRELQEGFTLIPVLLNGVTPEELDLGLYGVLRIRKDQCVNANGVRSIVNKVSRGLGPAASASLTPFERMESILARILERDADTQSLQEAWAALQGNQKPAWQPNQTRRFSSALTRFLLRDSKIAVNNLRFTLDKIQPRINIETAKELLKNLACLWVDAEAASGISATANQGGLIALNGNYLPDFTAQRYCERAWPFTGLWRMIQVDASQRTHDAICDVIRQRSRPLGINVPDAAVDRRIRQEKSPVLVLIPSAAEHSQLPDDDLLAQLCKTYPNLIFMIGTGERLPDWLPPEIRVLIPELDIGIEEDQLFALGDIKRFINERLPKDY